MRQNSNGCTTCWPNKSHSGNSFACGNFPLRFQCGDFVATGSYILRPRAPLSWLDPAKGKVKIDYRPVHSYTMSNDIAYIPPKQRVY